MVRHLEFNDPEFEPVDNCYAEPAPANPNDESGKEYKDCQTQSYASTNPEYNNM